MALAIAKVLNLSAEHSTGLFYAACVPGGGVGHLMVSILGGNRALSIAMNCIGTFVAVG